MPTQPTAQPLHPPDRVAPTRSGGRERRIITRNPRMRALLEQLERMAGAQATVLIQGESGTGKELVAQALHRHSERRASSFVRLNCAALPEGVLESELFGHEKGAFTGAVRQRAGCFERAHGGTLFLDEIGAADAKVQVRLLRVLQEGEFERVGGSQTLRVEVRVIAATNVDLGREVRAGNFREDLFYRLSVVPVHLPPLRERPEDIPLLVEHFAQRAARRNGRRLEGISAEVVDCLRRYPWPGNVRQLENVVERMVIFARGPRLERADVPGEIIDWRAEEGLAEMGGGSLQEARSHFEKRFLCQVLRRHRGVLSQVAEEVCVSRKHLYAKLADLGIDYQEYRA